MEKNKLRIVICIFVGIILVLLCFAGYKALNDHNKKEYLVVNNRIKEAAKKCYLEGKCKDKITLNDLYLKEYLTTQIDPITKEDMDKNICIEYIDKVIKFCN